VTTDDSQLPQNRVYMPRPALDYSLSPNLQATSRPTRATIRPPLNKPRVSTSLPHIRTPIPTQAQPNIADTATVFYSRLVMCREIVETYTSCPCRYDSITLCNNDLQKAPVKQFRQCKEDYYFNCARKQGKMILRQGCCGCCSSNCEKV